MNFSAPCLPNLARDHITWELERNAQWLAPSPDLMIQNTLGWGLKNYIIIVRFLGGSRKLSHCFLELSHL